MGASGVLHGLMAAGVVAYVRRRDPLGWIMAALLAAKLAYEQVHGPLPFAGKGVPVVVDAHLYGASAALLAAILLRWAPRQVPELGTSAAATLRRDGNDSRPHGS